MSNKVIVVGIDGASWRLIAPLVSKGELPGFRRLIARGFVGTLRSTVPADSPPAWTSIFTGVNPGKHGIVDFLLREKNGFVPCLSRYRMCQSIWRILSAAGLRCIILNEPVTFPPEPVNGIMTSGLMTPPGSSEWVYPKELRHEIESIAGGYECDIPPEFKSFVINNRRYALAILRKMAMKLFRVSRYLASNYAWDLLVTIFTTTDRLQHYWWRDPNEIAEHYRIIDGMIGEYLKLSEKCAADLIVVSDHGFGPSDEFFWANEWLEQLGLVVYEDSLLAKTFSSIGFTKSRLERVLGDWPTVFRILPPFLQELIRTQIPESTETRKIDYGRSVAYARSSAGIFVEDASQREYIAQMLGTLRSKITGKMIFDNVINRDEELRGTYSYRAPDLLLEPSLGHHTVVFRRDVETGLVGTHRPEGIFIHYRPGSQSPGSVPYSIRPWDVGASIVNLCGLPIPGYFDGRPVILN